MRVIRYERCIVRLQKGREAGWREGGEEPDGQVEGEGAEGDEEEEEEVL